MGEAVSIYRRGDLLIFEKYNPYYYGIGLGVMPGDGETITFAVVVSPFLLLFMLRVLLHILIFFM